MTILARMFRWFVGYLQALSSSASRSSSPKFEVERKYRLREGELDKIAASLAQIGFQREGTAVLTDTFLPAQAPYDLMRVRDETRGKSTSSVLTAKRWEELDGERERRESESSLDELTRSCLLLLGNELSRSELLSYSKKRTTFTGKRSGFAVTVALDEAEGLGEFSGTYLEVEIIAKRDRDLSSARQEVERFAVELLGAEREVAPSYGEMLRRSRSVS